MNPPDALQLLIISHAREAETGDFPKGKHYVEAIHNAFVRQETNELVRELSLVDEQGTGAAARRFYVDGKDPEKPLLPPEASELDKALHTLVVLIVSRSLVEDDAVVARLEEIAVAVRDSEKRHGFVVLGTSEEVLSSLRQKPQANALKEPQGWSVEKLGEYPLRPAYAAMLSLHKAHQLLARGLAPAGVVPASKSRFFISHAKLDGLSLAQSLSHTISQLAWLGKFYDAEDIQPGDDFKEVLKLGVLDSMLLILRTDIYDLRFWCRQEVMWAEAYDRPALLVDARAELLNRASVLGFTGIPGVRIPDGNLVRVLMEGLREWVRIGILGRRFREVVKPNSPREKETVLLSRPPSLTSLAEAMKVLRERLKDQADAPARIVHSEPPLEANHSDAAQDLIKSSFKNGAVLSFKAFLAQLSS
jgi:hypothetical protein